MFSPDRYRRGATGWLAPSAGLADNGPSVAVGISALAAAGVVGFLLGRSAGYEHEHDLLHKVMSRS